MSSMLIKSGKFSSAHNIKVSMSSTSVTDIALNILLAELIIAIFFARSFWYSLLSLSAFDCSFLFLPFCNFSFKALIWAFTLTNGEATTSTALSIGSAASSSIGSSVVGVFSSSLALGEVVIWFIL